MSRLPVVSLIKIEAQVLPSTLTETVVFIWRSASQALDYSRDQRLAELRKQGEDWEEESAGCSLSQVEELVESTHLSQMQALSAMMFALLTTQLMDFLNKGLSSKSGNFDKLAKSYQKEHKIDLDGLEGAKICRELILARNACLYNEGVPSLDYTQKTDCNFVVNATSLGRNEMLVFSDETLTIATRALGAFALGVAESTGKSKTHPKT